MNDTAEPVSLALVTGAAHRLGRAIAQELARRGYLIGLHYHAAGQAARQTAAELELEGARVVLLPADLTDPAQIEDLFLRVDALKLPLKVLVNSAGVMARGDLRTLSVETWDATLALNLRAPWLCARAAALRMSGGGVIINVIDSGFRQTWSTFPAYTISKAGLETLTRLLAKTLAPQVRVNGVAPGLILRAESLPEEDWQRLVERLPLKRSGSPQDVARAVSYLIQSEYVTGQTLVVDGGYQLL